MNPQIKIENLSKSFRTANGTVNALQNISLEIFKGECVVVAGENGSGKSVLMSIIAGLDSCNSGSVMINEDNKTSATKNRPPVGLVFQEAETQILGETPADLWNDPEHARGILQKKSGLEKTRC